MDIDTSHLDLLPTIVSSLSSLASSLLHTRLQHTTSASPQDEPTFHSEHLNSASPLFAALKSIHRSTCSMSAECKKLASESRSEVDEVHLGLQNLVYERRHLEREIAECKSFETEYQNIVLHSIDDFTRAMLSTEEIPSTDPHQLMLSRLRFELAERKRFEAEKKELLQRKLKLSKENDEKKAQLDELEKQLDDFVTAAKEIDAKMAAQA